MNLSSIGLIAAGLFALLPFFTSRHMFYAAVNTKFFVLMSVVVVLALIAASRVWKGEQVFCFKNRPLLWAGLGALALYWVAALFGEFPERSLYSDIIRSTGVLFLTHLAALSVIFAEFFRQRDWQAVRRTIALSSAAAALLLLIGVEGFGVEARLLWTNLGIPGYTFGNTTFAGTYLLLALVVSLIEWSRTARSSKWFWWLGGSSLLIFLSPVLFNIGILFGRTPLGEVFSNPVLILGSARASSAAAILLLVFYGGDWVLRRYAGAQSGRALLAWAAAFVLAMVAGLGLLFTPGSVVQEKYIEASTGARLLIWESSFAGFQERPLLGWGSENLQRAAQTHFDNRLYQDDFIGEIWFDRAHNIIIDTLVDVGVLGAISLVVVAGVFLRVVYRARRDGVVGEPEAVLLLALPFAHFLQLQTGFDTVASYALLAFLGGYGLSLERGTPAQEKKGKGISKDVQVYYRAGVVVLVALALVSAKFLLLDEFNRQNALFKLFVEKDAAKQFEYVETATSRHSSFESTRLTTGSLLKGMTETVAAGKLTPQIMGRNLPQLELLEERYRRYLEAQPEDYRAHVGLVYLLATQSAFGEKKLEEAKEVVARAYPLSPENPLTPSLDALVELYSGNLAAARAKAQEALALNPAAPFSQRVVEHVEKQAARFPVVTVLRLENL